MSHFLAPMLRRGAAGQRFALGIRGTAQPIVDDLRAAFDGARRNRGLLGQDGLPDGEGLVLAPCSAIHTVRMRFPIDVVFAARDGRVLKVAAAVPPWRVRLCWRAFAVVELAAGVAARGDVRAGVTLEVRPLTDEVLPDAHRSA